MNNPDFLFFFKTFTLTVVLVVLMQLQIGEKTIENHALGFVQSSAVVQPLNGVAKGAAKLAKDCGHKISALVQKYRK
jgi:hypothetical protein